LLWISGQANACEQQLECLFPNSWQLSVAVGVGVRTNPLVDGDNVPLLILPDIAWYGEAAYFDNGELGYQWYEEDTHAFETFVHLDAERSFFSFWDPANIFLPLDTSFVSSPDFDNPEQAAPLEVSKNDIASRKWAINGGVRWHIYQKNSEWLLSLETDVTSVHNGSKLNLSYQQRWQLGNWRVAMTPSLIWKSDKLVDYYYGVSSRDKVDSTLYYRANGGWQTKLAFTAQTQLTEHWMWLFMGSYQTLHSGMTDSPLIQEKDIKSIFIGLAYRFK
jgi:outer membrane protein